MMKLTVSDPHGEYIGDEEFDNTSDLLVACLTRPAIRFYLKSREDGKLICERYIDRKRS